MMQSAFIEIRASRSLNASKKFADIFHNLPMMLVRSTSDEDDQLIYEKLLKSAQRYNMEDYVKELRELAEKGR